ncbi:MAG: hypothetical protein ACI802_002881, partial [Candidatus Paceibacteria bacterium]
ANQKWWPTPASVVHSRGHDSAVPTLRQLK